MNPPDQSPERLDRLKQILADSYPQTAAEDREPLPPSVLAELEGKAGPSRARSAEERRTIVQRLSDWFRTPQLAGLAAVIALLVVAIVVLLPDLKPPAGGGGGTMRSGGGVVHGPAVIVLHELTDDQVAALRGSGFFRAEQIVVVETGEDLGAILSDRKQANLIVVDGGTGRITAPHAANASVVAMELPADNADLATAVLDVLAELPEPEPEPESGVAP